jgi:hypothetical protein
MQSNLPGGWRLLRSMIPPWGDRLDDPLLHYEVHPKRRTGGTPLGFIIIGVLMGAGAITYLIVTTFTQNSISTQEQIDTTFFIVVMGLVSMSILGHWRLLLTTIGHSTAMIAQKRERGDWDLIYITSVSKSRWFHVQFIALGWQMFPLVRRLMIVQLVLAIVVFPKLIILQQDQYTIVPPALYGIELLMLGAIVMVEPIFTAGIFASSALLESSMRRRAWVSFTNGLSMIYAMRVVMALVMQIGGLIFLIVLSAIFADGSLEELPGNAVLYLCIYCIISSLLYAFILEWLPAIAAILLTAPFDTDGNLYAFLWVFLTLGLTQIITPPILMGLLAERSVRRLNRPER